MIKKLLQIIASLAFTLNFLMIPVAVHAVDVLDPSICNVANPPSICKDKIPVGGTNPIFGPDGILTKAIFIMSIVVAVTAVIVIIIAGIRYMVSQGDPGKLANARNTIIYALVAIAVTAVAQAVVAFVLKKL